MKPFSRPYDKAKKLVGHQLWLRTYESSPKMHRVYGTSDDGVFCEVFKFQEKKTAFRWERFINSKNWNRFRLSCFCWRYQSFVQFSGNSNIEFWLNFEECVGGAYLCGFLRLNPL